MSNLHWGEVLTGEESAVRKYMLKRYAWVEVRFIAFTTWLLKLPVTRNTLAKKVIWYSLARFMGMRAIVSQVTTRQEMYDFIDGLPADSAIAVGPCRCRLATGGCKHPLETDIVILTGTPIWTELFPADYRLIGREEAKKIVGDCYELGLVPMLDRHMYYHGNANYFVICNCCDCSCVIMLAYHTFKKIGYRLVPSGSHSVVDREKCKGDGACVEACIFGERMLVDGKVRILDCQGCGQCVRVCPYQANRMVAR